MNKGIIKESLIYDELGLSPIWVTLIQKKLKLKMTNYQLIHLIFNLKKIKLDNLNVLFIAPISNSSDTIELELFKKISVYLDTLSDKLSQPESIKISQEAELISEIQLL